MHLTQVVKQLSTTGDEGFISQLNKEAVERAKAYLVTMKERLQGTFKDLNLSITWSVALDADARSNTMFQRILVPLDGSEGSERAIPIVARIARTSGGSIVFIRVVPPPAEIGTFGVGIHGTVAVKPEVEASEKDLADAASYLAALMTAYAGDLAGIDTETDVATGAASPTIFSAARFEHVDLIVMCSHGETGLKRWMLGSVAQEAVRRSPVPVLALNEHGVVPAAPDAPHPFRILVPLDGSALSETVLLPAAQLIAVLAAPAPGEMHLLRVVDLPSAYGKMKSQAYIPDSMQEEALKGMPFRRRRLR